MRLFHEPKERTPQQFTMSKGPPQDGAASCLAGIAEPGDRVDVLNFGSYVNVGTKASPRWERLYSKAPASSSGEWRALSQGDTHGR
jgi:hypothetical protein